MRTYALMEGGEEPLECGMCGAEGFHRNFVWWCEAPCCSAHPERGGRVVCESCHDRWAEWDDRTLVIAQARGVRAILHLRFPG